MRSRARQIWLPHAGSAGPIGPNDFAFKRSAATRKALPPAPRPWQTIVLGIDTARHSGWAISAAGKYAQSGELDMHDADAIRKVIGAALQLAAIASLPCVLVLERPWGGSVATIAGLGAAREAWEREWRELAEGHRGKIVRVHVSTWRAAILGGAYVGKPQAECRDAERAMALAIMGYSKRQVGPDEAPACCIAYWGSQAGEVGLVLSNRAREASLKFWREKR